MILIPILGKMYVPTLLMLVLVLVSALTYQVDSAPLGTESYSSSNESTHQSPDGFECYGCGPGQFVAVHCSTDLGNSICRPCPRGSFSAKYDKATKCQDCKRCGLGMIVSSECSPTADRVCDCEEGKELTHLSGSQVRCDLKPVVTLAIETVTEQTTPEAATNRSGCPRGSFCNYTTNQNTPRNNHTTDSTITYIVVIVVAIVIVVIVVIVVNVGIGATIAWIYRKQEKMNLDVDCNEILISDKHAPANDNADTYIERYKAPENI